MDYTQIEREIMYGKEEEYYDYYEAENEIMMKRGIDYERDSRT